MLIITYSSALILSEICFALDYGERKVKALSYLFFNSFNCIEAKQKDLFKVFYQDALSLYDWITYSLGKPWGYQEAFYYRYVISAKY